VHWIMTIWLMFGVKVTNASQTGENNRMKFYTSWRRLFVSHRSNYRYFIKKNNGVVSDQNIWKKFPHNCKSSKSVENICLSYLVETSDVCWNHRRSIRRKRRQRFTSVVYKAITETLNNCCRSSTNISRSRG